MITEQRVKEGVTLTLYIDADLYDAIAETAERMGYALKEWCVAALEVGVEANVAGEEEGARS